MSAPLVLVGTPQLVDSFFRPIARIGQALVGVVAGALLWAFGFTWWVPLPFAALVLLGELWFWRRADRAQTLRIEGSTLRLTDPLAPAGVAIDLREITVATLFYRQLPLGELEVVISLGDDRDVRFALRVLQRAAFERRPHDVPAEVHDLLLGGLAGLFRALAPPALRPRQVFLDPEGTLVARLRELLPAEAWRRTGIRLWQGMEPPIDLFGYYEGPHTDWLVLDGRDWRRAADAGSIAGWTLSGSERSAVLFQGMEQQRAEQLPLALFVLGSATTVAVPAPAAPGLGDQPLTSDLLHTHAPEGAALLWHLLVHTPKDVRPAVLGEMIADRRPLRPDLEQLLPG